MINLYVCLRREIGIKYQCNMAEKLTSEAMAEKYTFHIGLLI